MNWLFLWMVKRFVILLSLKNGKEPQNTSTMGAQSWQEKLWMWGTFLQGQLRAAGKLLREHPFLWQEFL